MDIGKKVHFLKILRSSRFYEYAREERLEIIKRLVIPSIWYDPSHRASLCIALHKLNSFICEDMRVELFINHRMIDHISLVHAYFFMLRGDLFAELERLTRLILNYKLLINTDCEVYSPFLFYLFFLYFSLRK